MKMFATRRGIISTHTHIHTDNIKRLNKLSNNKNNGAHKSTKRNENGNTAKINTTITIEHSKAQNECHETQTHELYVYTSLYI